jgi:predicted GNAT family N-acyltransferase
MNAHVNFPMAPQAHPCRRNRRSHVRVARGFDDIAMVYAIRAAVYLAEQNCPYHEEFDGNDACSMHFVGFIGDEPAGVLRARYFAEFVKLERLAVLKRFRRSTIAFELVREGISVARRKGFSKIYGHSREGLEPFWARFGAKPFADNRKIEFSDHRYVEMVIDLEPDPDAIGLMSGGRVIVRPEGDWDRPGILDESGLRGSTHLTENAVRTRTP